MTACLLDRTLKLKVSTLLKSHKSNLSPVSDCVGIQVGSFLSRLPGDHQPTISLLFPATIFQPLADYFPPRQRPKRGLLGPTNSPSSIATLQITIQQSILVRLLHDSHQLHGSGHRPSVTPMQCRRHQPSQPTHSPTHCRCCVDNQTDWSEIKLSHEVIILKN